MSDCTSPTARRSLVVAVEVVSGPPTTASNASCCGLTASSETRITQSINTIRMPGTINTFIPIGRRLSMYDLIGGLAAHIAPGGRKFDEISPCNHRIQWPALTRPAHLVSWSKRRVRQYDLGQRTKRRD